jgi:hypothetical protein
MDKRIRERLKRRLQGFEYRQRDREQQRSARQRAYRTASMMREQGTLAGARKYLDMKGVAYRQTDDPRTGRVTLIVPGQVSFAYGPDGRFVSSGPAAAVAGTD